MAQLSRAQIKAFFETDDIPTQQEFADFVDSTLWYDEMPADGVDGQDGAKGDKGDTGDPGADGNDGAPGEGIPIGGAVGQTVVKASATNYDTAWGPEIIDGGTLPEKATPVAGDLTIILDSENGGSFATLRYDKYGGTPAPTDRNVNAQTGTAYTAALVDVDGIITMDNAAGNTLTLPAHATVAIPVGTKMEVWMLGAGATTIEGAAGVTLRGNGGTAVTGSCTIQTQFGGASLTKLADDAWIIGGDIDEVA